MTWPRKFFLTFLFFWMAPFQALAEGRIVVVEISGAINPVVAEFVTDEITDANRAGEELILIRMDTPGGLDSSMRRIIKGIQGSGVPVAAFVGPGGSRAASAGTFIAIASHIAAMAPGTNIGAAHPVNLMGGGGGEQATVMESKVVQDASAYIRSLAEKRGRNAHWAELAVTKSVSVSAEEAKKLNVIDLVAFNVQALALALEGREVVVDSQTVILATEGKEIVYHEMNKRQKILDVISNPNVAYILMMLGLFGLFFELSNPGLILPGVIGGVSMILALYAMQTLPINYAGLLLIVLGLVFFIAEINVMSFGLLAVGGVISVFLGSLMLIDSEDPVMRISKTVLFPTLGFFMVFSLGALYFAAKSQRRRAVSGVEGLIGARGVVKADLDRPGLGRPGLDRPGSVLIHGEVWNAESEGKIESGKAVIVDSVDGLKLKVKAASELEPPPDDGCSR